MDWSMVLWAFLIFLARAVDVGMGTIRVQLIVRRRKLMAALIGFIEVMIYILIVSRVIRDIGEWQGIISLIPVFAYGAGFGVGTILGISISERMGRGVVETTIISHEPCEGLEDAIRAAGFALTRYQGMGREGQVNILSVVSMSRAIPRLIHVISSVDPKAFTYTHDLTGMRGGYLYKFKGK